MTLLFSSSHGCFYNFGRPGIGCYLYPSIYSAAFRGATARTLQDKLHGGEACVEGYALIILLIGGNDVDTRYSARTLCQDIIDLVHVIRRFNRAAHIAVLSILPRLSPKNSRMEDYMDKAVKLNKRLERQLRDVQSTSFVKVHKLFLSKGSRRKPNRCFFSPDGVHFNDMGVRRLAGTINEIFEKYESHELDGKVTSYLDELEHSVEGKGDRGGSIAMAGGLSEDEEPFKTGIREEAGHELVP